MNFYKKLKLNARFSLTIMLILIVTFTIFGIIIYNTQGNTFKNKVTEALQSQMDDLVSVIELQNLIDSLQKENSQKLSPGYILNTFSNIYIDSSQINQALSEIIDINELIKETSNYNQSGKKAIFKNIIDRKRYYEDGYAFCMTPEGKVVVHPFSAVEGKNFKGKEIHQKIIEGSENPIRYRWTVNNITEWRWAYYTFNTDLEWYIIISVSEENLFADSLRKLGNIVLGIIFITVLLIFFTLNYLLRNSVIAPIIEVIKQLKKLSKGFLAEKIHYNKQDEVGEITHNLNNLVDGLRKTAEFANNIGQGKLNAQFTPLSKEDVLGNSLLEMRESLKKAKEEEDKRRIEDQKRSWSTQGLAKFGEILRRDNDKLDVLAFNVVKNLVDYLKVNLCGLFILNDDDLENKFIELVATYAYDRKKFLEKKVEIGEGLIGSCFKEKKLIYLKEVPEDYIHISSGLGEEPPSELLLVPLKLNEDVYGVLEIASFKAFAEHEIDFVEKVGESIASTISSVKINMKTTELLEKSQQQAEEMRAQEEEMRQNMEELTATQEALSEKDRENQQKLKELNEAHLEILEEVQFKEEQNRTILQNAIDAVLIIDKNGIINFFNKAAEKIFGYKSNEVLGKNIKILMPEDQAENHDDHIRSYIETGVKKVIDTSRPVPIKMKDGTVKDAILALTETKVKSESLFTGFIKDLTAYGRDQDKLLKKVKLLKKCEENLENTEEQFKNTVSRYNMLIGQYKALINLELDKEFKILEVNDALLRLLKVASQEKIVGESFDIMLSDEFKASDVYKNLKTNIDKKHHIEEVIELQISKLKTIQVKANIAKFENKLENEIRYIFVFTNISELVEKIKEELPKQIETKTDTDKKSSERLEDGDNKDIIIQLEEELSKALEEIDELKSKLARKK